IWLFLPIISHPCTSAHCFGNFLAYFFCYRRVEAAPHFGVLEMSVVLRFDNLLCKQEGDMDWRRALARWAEHSEDSDMLLHMERNTLPDTMKCVTAPIAAGKTPAMHT
ncbi:hypothetical protein BDQ17DRAFT_1375990, partial [Cyathus striatus]